jgi:serine/threonine-protein kinase
MSDTVELPPPPAARLKPGDIIAGRYRLERELGRGAMGTVWAALHTTLGQRVAIKLIADDKARSPEARQRFSVEAKAAARLRSRHVVQVYDDGETPEGMPYIVMEYLDGQTLEERLETEPELGLGEAVRIATHVGRALARAHAQGVVHRDLKSGNIFLAKSDDDELGWVAKVLDFGVAKVMTPTAEPSATRTGTIVGTPLFMSPEQIRGAGHVDQRADLYSLGIVFYNMVTRAHAFDGPSYSDVLVAICTQPLPDIRLAAPWLPPALGAWFDKACARERDQRFQSADEMIEALQQAAGPSARLARPSAPDELGGPSGTLVGHAPPHAAPLHAAQTLLSPDVSEATPNFEPAASVAREASLARPEPSPESSGRMTTLRSSPPAAPEAAAPRVDVTSSALPAPRAQAGLWLWATSGAGLAVALTGLALVVTRAAALWNEPRRAAESPPTEATIVPPAPPPSSLAAAPPPPSAPPAPNTATTSAPTLALPTPSARARDVAAVTPRRPSSTPRRADSATAPVAKTPLMAASRTQKPPASPAAPDMGF